MVRAVTLTPEQRELVVANMWLIGWFVKRHPCPRGGYWKDEYIARVQWALLTAAVGYNPRSGKFSTYAVLKMRTARRDFLEILAYRKPIDATGDGGDGDEDPVAWRSGREPDPAHVALVNDELAWCRCQVTARQWDVLCRHLHGETAAELARRLGVTPQSVDVTELRGRTRIRRASLALYDRLLTRSEPCR